MAELISQNILHPTYPANGWCFKAMENDMNKIALVTGAYRGIGKAITLPMPMTVSI
ncbi:MAG: hypothetical protein PHN45_05215 [Methylococcales bacterium]|nr:hypothetical protein [Methylococcales bacterium]